MASRLPAHSPGGVETVVRRTIAEIRNLRPEWTVDAVSAYPGRGGLERLPGVGELLASVLMARRARAGDYDVVFVHGAEYAWAFVAGRRLLAPCRSVAVWHGVSARSVVLSRPSGDLKARALARFRRSLERRALQLDAALVTNAKLVPMLREEYDTPRPFIVTGLGIDDERVRQLASDVDRSGQSLRILWVGQTAYRKGLDVAVAAVGLLRANTNVEFAVVGLRGHRDLPDWVLDLGVIEDTALVDLYRRADIFLLPSRWEGFGLVLLEAMAAGAAVVTERSVGTGIIEDGRNGRLIDGYSPADYAAAIRDLGADRKALDSIREANRADVRRFGWRSSAAIYVSVAERLTSPMRPQEFL